MTQSSVFLYQSANQPDPITQPNPYTTTNSNPYHLPKPDPPDISIQTFHSPTTPIPSFVFPSPLQPQIPASYSNDQYPHTKSQTTKPYSSTPFSLQDYNGLNLHHYNGSHQHEHQNSLPTSHNLNYYNYNPSPYHQTSLSDPQLSHSPHTQHQPYSNPTYEPHPQPYYHPPSLPHFNSTPNPFQQQYPYCPHPQPHSYPNNDYPISSYLTSTAQIILPYSSYYQAPKPTQPHLSPLPQNQSFLSPDTYYPLNHPTTEPSQPQSPPTHQQTQLLLTYNLNLTPNL